MTRNKIIHRVAICFGCDWSDDDVEQAVKRARAHNKKTGHAVNIESAYTIDYEGIKK